MNLAQSLLLPLLCITACASAETGVSLESYVKDHPQQVYTYSPDAKIPLGKRDQDNNFKDSDKLLLLSDNHLTDLAGLSKLTVTDGGKAVSIRDVKNLHLFLNDNQITEVPPEIAELGNVKFIYFNQNQIKMIPPEVARMAGLQGMYFTRNDIGEIPPWVFTIKQLGKLQVSDNQLEVLPEAIGNLTKLIHLNLSGNKIKVLPESIAKLTELRVCDLSDNELTELPESFGQVKVSHQLRIKNNPISHLPEGFAGMLGTIDVTGTRIDVNALPPKLRERIDTKKPDYLLEKKRKKEEE